MPRHGADLSTVLSAGGAAAAIGGVYKLGEFLFHAKKLRDVGPSNAVYVRVINRVRADLDEVRRLLTVREVHDSLEANQDKAKWVYGAMRDVRGALENIAPHTERVGSDIDAGRHVGLRHRVFWLLSEKEKLENREKELFVAHATLNEVLGYLTALEPDAHRKHHETHRKEETKEKVDKTVDVDVHVRHEGPERERIERDVYVEHHDRGPSKRVVEERGTWVEYDQHAPRRVEEHWVEHEHGGPRRVREHHVEYEHQHRGPPRAEDHYHEREQRSHYDERQTWVDEHGRPRRYDEREVFERQYGPRAHDGRFVEERELHVERDPRDPRHVEARYTERGPDHYEEKRYEERRFPEPLGRRPESFEDRLPERDSWRQSDPRRPQYSGQHGEYAQYGAPQHLGAAHHNGLPPNREFEREVWIEEKEDFRYDQYGNRLPDRFFPNMPPRDRM